MRKLDLKQNTPEWEEFRRQCFGASEAGTLCGVNPYDTLYKLLKRKITGEKVFETIDMRTGKLLEPEAIRKAEELLGTKFEQMTILHDNIDYFLASLDGYSEEKMMILETKVVGDNTFQRVKKEGPLNNWIYQVQQQIDCVGPHQEDAHILVMHRETGETKLCVVDREEEIISTIHAKGKEAWERLVNFDLPEDSHIMRDDADWRTLAEEFLSAKEMAEMAEVRLKYCRERLIEAAGDSSCKGFGVTATRYLSKGTVDYKAIPELERVDLNQYRKKSKEAWRVA